MIEILLALGVTAIGICSIMVLFPIGANASRDAAMETYGANAADEVLHEIRYQASQDWSKIGDFDEISNDPLTPKLPDYNPNHAHFAFAPMSDSALANWEETFYGNSKSIIQSKTYKGTFLIISHKYGDKSDIKPEDIAPEEIDSSAILYITKEKIDINGNKVNFNYGARLHAELSWPASLNYTLRKKAYYVMDIYKSQN